MVVRLKHRLIASFVLVGVVPLLLTLAVVTVQVGERLKTQTVQRMEQLAALKVQQLERQQQAWLAQLEMLTRNLESNYEGMDDNGIISAANYDSQFYQQFTALFGFADMKLVRPDGQVIFTLSAARIISRTSPALARRWRSRGSKPRPPGKACSAMCRAKRGWMASARCICSPRCATKGSCWFGWY